MKRMTLSTAHSIEAKEQGKQIRADGIIGKLIKTRSDQLHTPTSIYQTSTRSYYNKEGEQFLSKIYNLRDRTITILGIGDSQSPRVYGILRTFSWKDWGASDGGKSEARRPRRQNGVAGSMTSTSPQHSATCTYLGVIESLCAFRN